VAGVVVAELRALVLGGGKGTRMKSSVPKLLHKICGKSMLSWVVDAVSDAGVEKVLIVTSPQIADSDEIQQMSASLISQDIPLGTGHALLQARNELESFDGNWLIVNGDTPAIRPASFSSLIQKHESSGAFITVMTSHHPFNGNMGLISRKHDTDDINAIVEYGDEDYDVNVSSEFNVGAYCIRSELLPAVIGKIPESSTNEFYITRLVEIAYAEGLLVDSYTIEDSSETIGVNTLHDLSRARLVLQNRINTYWLLNGVDIVEPCYIEISAHIDKDSVIYQNTSLQGDTHIGKGSKIGPNSRLLDTSVGADCNIFESVIESSTIGNAVNIGPFSHIRHGSYIESGVKIGNFAEIKNSRIGKEALIGHFSYLGDCFIGNKVNIGAGTITCNFDGKEKHQTIIEEGAFIGSDTKLIAPVKVGSNAITGAGSVVTKDVRSGTTVVGMPARPIDRKTPLSSDSNKEGAHSGY
tara:strand:+ start:484 stop:1887 length:1404 start_codon:yes stop_codon:yes gene_type:complete